MSENDDYKARFNGLMASHQKALALLTPDQRGMLAMRPDRGPAELRLAMADRADLGAEIIRLRAALGAERRFANLRPDAMFTVPPAGPAVYVLRDAEARVLYVGMTDSVVARLGQHATDKPWWPAVATIDVYTCSLRAEAARLEHDLINFLDPRYNVSGRRIA